MKEKDNGVNLGIASLAELAKYRSQWDLKLNEDVPMEMTIDLGTGPSTLSLGALTLSRLNIEGGAGPVTLDLSGEWQNDLDASIVGGLGPLNLRLPGNVGLSIEVENGIGPIGAGALTRDGNTYTNDTYGRSEVTVRNIIEGWAGPINLRVE